MFLHEPGEEAESFSRMELSTANSRQTKEQAYAQPAQTARQSVAAAQQHLGEMARANSHVGSTSDNDAASALPSTANWAKNSPTPASRPASLVHQATNNHQSKVSTPSPKDPPSSPLVQNVQTVRPHETAKKPLAKPTTSTTADALTKATNVNGKPVGIIGQAVPSATTTEMAQPTKAPKPIQPKLPAFMMEQVERLQKIQRAIGNPNFRFVLSPKAFSPDEYDALCKIPPMFDKQGGKRRRELMEKLRGQQQQRGEQGDDVPRGEAGPQPPIGTASTLGSIGLSPLGIHNRSASPPLPQQRESIMPKEASGLQSQGLQGLNALQQDTLQQQAALGAQTSQSVVQQGGGQQAFSGAFQNGQAPLVPPQHQPGHSRQSSRYTFANDNPMTASTTVNARGNAAHMAEQVRMMPPQQQQQISPQQLAQMYGGAPGLGGLLGGVQQPPPGLKNAPTPPAPGLGGIPMGNMPQFSGMTLGGHHGKNENESVLLRELLAGSGPSRMGGVTNASLMRGGDGKRNIPFAVGGREGFTDRRGVVDLGDPSILQARVAQPQHQMHQHQQGIQAGSHGQQGGYNPNLNLYYAQATGRW
jgi:CCR4-NOT transcription complex subunit 4